MQVFTFAVNSSDRVLRHTRRKLGSSSPLAKAVELLSEASAQMNRSKISAKQLFLTSSEAGAMSGRDGISDHRGGARRLLNEMESLATAGLLAG